MKLAWFVLLISLSGCLSMRRVSMNMFDLTVVIEASGLPNCARSCMSDLFLKAAELITLKDPVETFKDICDVYNNASSCVAEKEECLSETTFEFVFKGIDELCNEKAEELEPQKECLENSTDTVLKSCDEGCGFTDSLVTLSMQENVRRIAKLRRNHELMVWELSPVCNSTGCMMACIAEELNNECENTGSIIVEALLKPFISSAVILDELGPRARASARSQLPEQCQFIIDRQELENIVNGTAPETTRCSGLESSGLESSGLESSGLESSGLESSGLESSGLESSGLESSGEASGMESSGEASGMESSGEASGMESSGEASGMESSGETSGMESSGEASGMESSGEASGMESSGEASGMESSGEASGMESSGEASGMEGRTNGGRSRRFASHSHESREVTRPRPVTRPAPSTTARPRPIHRDSRDSRDSRERNRA